MQKEINISRDAQIGDIKTVHLLTKRMGLNNGKGYSVSLISAVKKGVRNNEEVTNLFKKVIHHRNELWK